MFRDHKYILGILALFFLVGYGFLVTPLLVDSSIGLRFDWPDEVANYFWINQYAQTGQLSVAEPLNQVAENQIHPRSFNVTNSGELVPGSFLGLILLYGFLAKLFSSGIIIYLTPLFAVIGMVAFYGIIRRIFDPQIALLSSVLLLIHPAWWYYSATSLLPNITFVSLLLVSFYFLLRQAGPRPTIPSQFGKQSLPQVLWLNLGLAAVAAGLAISIRPAEIVWVALVYLVLFLVIRRQITPLKIIVFLAVIFLLMIPSLYYQQLLYDSWATTGYAHLQSSDLSGDAGCPSCAVIEQVVAPFGFHPYLIGLNFWNHFLSRFWLWSLLAILGLVVLFTTRTYQQTRHFIYLFVSLFIAAFLGVYYGSWQFTDLLTLELNSLGISYVRYWLPLAVVSLPFIALGITWLTRFFTRRWIAIVLFGLFTFIGYQSAQLVLYQKADSIIPVKERIADYRRTARAVNAITEVESVIITVRKDKVFFPERRVIHTFDALSRNRELMGITANLIKQVPVYYYTLGPEPELVLNFNLVLEPVEYFDSEILYRVTTP